jgi:hypothetical protein
MGTWEVVGQLIKRLVRGVTDQAEPVPCRGVGQFPQDAAFPDARFTLDEEFSSPAGFGSPEQV